MDSINDAYCQYFVNDIENSENKQVSKVLTITCSRNTILDSITSHNHKEDIKKSCS